MPPSSPNYAPRTLPSSLADRLEHAATGNRYLREPGCWIGERLGEHLWSKQRQIAQAVADHRAVAVKSCHGVGKSFLAARLICWWIDTHRPGEAFVVSTAPSNPQVEAILWREINKAAAKADPPFPGRVLVKEWKIGNELVGYGRKPADTDVHGFQGIHAPYVLVVLDEACGIPDQLWVATMAITTNENCRILAIGNPDDPTSHFARVCEPGSPWHVIRIAAADSPNFTGEEVPPALAASLVGQPYLDMMAYEVGEGSPLWMSKVDGEFPADASDGVIPASAIARCRHAPLDGVPGDDVQLGVDVGGSEGGDRTVIRERRGRRAGRVWRMQSSKSEDVAAEICARIVETGAGLVAVDSVGIGWGVAGHLSAMRRAGAHGAVISKVNVGSAPANKKRFPKLRDELWWEVGRGLSERHDWDLSAIDDRTAADLAAPRWAPDPAGRIKVEPKADTKKRLGRSPDDADALLLAFYRGGTGATWGQAWERMAAESTQPPAPSSPRPDTSSGRPQSLGRLSDLMRH